MCVHVIMEFRVARVHALCDNSAHARSAITNGWVHTQGNWFVPARAGLGHPHLSVLERESERKKVLQGESQKKGKRKRERLRKEKRERKRKKKKRKKRKRKRKRK